MRPGRRWRSSPARTWRGEPYSPGFPRQRGSAGGLAFPDLGDEGLDGGEGEVRAVAEDGVTRTGKRTRRVVSAGSWLASSSTTGSGQTGSSSPARTRTGHRTAPSRLQGSKLGTSWLA